MTTPLAPDRGDGAVGSVISMVIFITLLMLFMWVILTYYSYRILSSAAQEGAVVAARYDADGPSPEEGKLYAEDLLNEAGASSFVDNIVAEGNVIDNRVEVVVSGDVNASLPIPVPFQMTLTATGSAPVEEFRPQGGE